MGVRKPNIELKEHKTWVGMIDFPDVECYNEVTKTNNRDSPPFSRRHIHYNRICPTQKDGKLYDKSK